MNNQPFPQNLLDAKEARLMRIKAKFPHIVLLPGENIEFMGVNGQVYPEFEDAQKYGGGINAYRIIRKSEFKEMDPNALPPGFQQAAQQTVEHIASHPPFTIAPSAPQGAEFMPQMGFAQQAAPAMPVGQQPPQTGRLVLPPGFMEEILPNGDITIVPVPGMENSLPRTDLAIDPNAVPVSPIPQQLGQTVSTALIDLPPTIDPNQIETYPANVLRNYLRSRGVKQGVHNMGHEKLVAKVKELFTPPSETK